MTTFKSLNIGDRFIFESERSMPHSGMERGPWVKTGSRKYTKAPGDHRPMDCRVGSINKKVIPLTHS